MKINIDRFGKLGEIYTDSRTGVSYKCVSQYRDSMGNVECDWEIIGEGVEIVREVNVSEDKIPEIKMDTELGEEDTQVVTPRHTNYNKQYRKNKR